MHRPSGGAFVRGDLRFCDARFGHPHAQAVRERVHVCGPGSTGGIDDDLGASPSIRQRIVVRELRKARGRGGHRQTIRVEIVGLARDLEAAQRAIWRADLAGHLGRPAQYLQIEASVVCHKHISTREGAQAVELFWPCGSGCDIRRVNAMDLDVPFLELVMSCRWADQPAGSSDDFAASDTDESDGAG